MTTPYPYANTETEVVAKKYTDRNYYQINITVTVDGIVVAQVSFYSTKIPTVKVVEEKEVILR